MATSSSEKFPAHCSFLSFMVEAFYACLRPAGSEALELPIARAMQLMK